MTNKPLYVIIQIGCIECGEPSLLVGVYDDIKLANNAKEANEIFIEGYGKTVMFKCEKMNKMI